MRTSTSVLVILLSVVIAMPRVQAQAAHSAGQSAIDAALQAHVSSAACRSRRPAACARESRGQGCGRQGWSRSAASHDRGCVTGRTGADAACGAGASGRRGARRRPVQGRYLDDGDHHRLAGADSAHRRTRLTSRWPKVGRRHGDAGTVSVRAFSVLLAVVLWVGTAEGGQSNRPLAILDVPFISQSEALCGGAAAAMVMRYWGARGLDAESFAHLVDRSAAGIRTTALIDDIRRRGWTATAIAGTDQVIARELSDGRPILTLIEDRPGTFHYIVIIGSTPRAVVYHDPARTAFRTMSREEFERRWAAAERWMALVVPPVGTPETQETMSAAVGDAPCDALIADGVRLAQSNDLDGAERRLTGALSCEGPAPLRELAGVRLLQRRWGEVSDLASAALAEDPSDAHAWRLLATSRFVQDDRGGALDAWNHVGEPRVDLIRVDGLVRTRQRIVEQLLPVQRNDVLTRERFVRARRQLRELPSAASTELTFVPVPSGLVELRATVAERSLLPADRWSLAALGVVAAHPARGGGVEWRADRRRRAHHRRVAFLARASARQRCVCGARSVGRPVGHRRVYRAAAVQHRRHSNVATARCTSLVVGVGGATATRVDTRRRRTLGRR